MKLKELKSTLHVEKYILDFYSGNSTGESEEEIIVSASDIEKYGSYVVHCIHTVNDGRAEITLRTASYGQN